jgi:exodeoxyribonuclease VII large subunit
LSTDDRQILTISEINAQARDVLEHFQVWLRGEVSEFKQSEAWVYNYLTLKDEFAQIRGVVSSRVLSALDFELTDGQEIIVFGKLSLYERRGDYQIKISKIEAVGKGSLQEQLEKLKVKLQAEGLFSEAIKKPLSRFPEKIGVITSRDGAAWKDFRKIIKQRWPYVELVLADVLVQGDSSPAQITAALDNFNKRGQVEVIVLTRGGGSLEDLWGFNDESVARAIHRSEIPVVSAVGHEKDVTIADLVADHRSSTPSNAAEEVVPEQTEMARQLDDFWSRLKSVRERWRDLPGEVDDLQAQVRNNFARLLQDKKIQAELLHRKIMALSPAGVLARGYSVVYRKDKIVRSAGVARLGEDLKIQLAKGGLFVTVKGKSRK